MSQPLMNRDFSPYSKTLEFEIDLREENSRILCAEIHSNSRPPVFSPDLIVCAQALISSLEIDSHSYEYLVWRSAHSRYFSMGGDINFFYDCIRENNRQALTDYAHQAIDVIYRNQYDRGRDFETVAYIDGKALGGGAEFALSADCLVITNRALIQLPEGRFGSFPGMGAYSFLVRKIGINQTRRIIQENACLDANFLIKNAIADYLIEDESDIFVKLNERLYHRNSKRRKNIENIISKVSREELHEIVEIWVGTFFSSKININSMRTMAKYQKRAIRDNKYQRNAA